MSYIAFIDMVGTRASAMISNEEYTATINDFTNSLKQVNAICNCKIYGYSDNAYAEFHSLSSMVRFFQIFRENLMNKHRYFTAAVDSGSLQADQISFGSKKGFSMTFTSSAATDIYMKQRQFSGIGISLSKSVINDLQEQKMEDAICQSVFHCCTTEPNEPEFRPVVDFSYTPVILEKINYIMADYLMAAATSVRAGRYYLTPIISMIKCLDKSVISKDLKTLVELLSFQSMPKAFGSLQYNNTYSLYFLLALIDYVLTMREKDPTIDAIGICEHIIKQYSNRYFKLVETLPTIPTSVISTTHKRQLLNILYNIKD